MDGYRIKAYAKVNLGLDVLRRLPSGYHEVNMVMQSVGLWDELTLEKRPGDSPGDSPGDIAITTDAPGLPTGEDNLIYKAARLMLDKYGCGGLRVHLRKNIPIAAGMAGGSADAAAVMKGINHLYRLGLSPGQLMEDGLAVGADVPFCILGGTALARGIGEKLTPLPPLPPCHILIAKPDISVSTKYVYEHLDAEGIEMRPDIDGMVQALRAGRLEGVLERMVNVLETVTVPAHPVIADIKARMRELGAADSLMSGSGPTVFGIFREEDRARAALEQFRRERLADRVFLTVPL